MPPLRAALTWAAFGAAVAVPITVAATSPLLQYRGPAYVAACFAGVLAMTLILAQPLLAGGYLPGLPPRRGRRVHRWTGAALVAAIVIHVGGLWITSPPDMIDALLFTAPAAFSAWGVVAMWALFAAALLAATRRRLRIRPKLWRFGHTALVAIAALGSVVHAMLVEGTMGTTSKAVLCFLVLAATAKTVVDLRTWTILVRREG